MRVRFGGEMREYDRDQVDKKSFGCDKGVSVDNGEGEKRKRIKVFYILYFTKNTSNSIFNIKN